MPVPVERSWPWSESATDREPSSTRQLLSADAFTWPISPSNSSSTADGRSGWAQIFFTPDKTKPNEQLMSPEYQRVISELRRRPLTPLGGNGFPAIVLPELTIFAGAAPEIQFANIGRAREVKDLVEKKEGVGEAFAATVQKTLESIPLSLRTALAQSGYRVVIADRLTNALPQLRNQHPRGWPPGTTWDHADGIQSQSQRVVAVAEYRRFGDNWIASDRVGGVLRHELGHAMDLVFGKAGENMSASTEFLIAYERDTREIKEADRKTLAYHLQPGEAGRSETFADMFALLMGGPTNERDQDALKRSFPEVRKLLQKKIDQVEKDFKKAGEKK